MSDQDKTKEQLIEELKDIRLKMAELEATESKLLYSERALKESEEKYRNLFNNAGVGMFRSRLDGSETLDVNDKFLKILNRTRDEVKGKPSMILWAHPHAREEMVRRLNADGQVTDFEYKMLNAQGEERTCLTSLRLYADQGIVEGSIVDITDRKRAEEQLQRSEEKYLNLFQDAPLMYVITRNEQDVPFISDCNKLFLRSVGFVREEVIGKPLADFYSPESQARLLEGGGYSRALEGEFVMGERQLVTRNGGIIQTLLYTKPETDYSGSVTGTRAMFVDITAARKAEETQRRLSTAVEQSIEAVMITDRNGKIQYINPAFEHISGYRKEEVIGRDTRFLKNEGLDSSYYRASLKID
jgi:PAS domain S-box-containing protein